MDERTRRKFARYGLRIEGKLKLMIEKLDNMYRIKEELEDEVDKKIKTIEQYKEDCEMMESYIMHWLNKEERFK